MMSLDPEDEARAARDAEMDHLRESVQKHKTSVGFTALIRATRIANHMDVRLRKAMEAKR